MAFLDQHIECPFPTRNNRKTGRPVTDYFCADDVFEGLLGRTHVFTEGFMVKRSHAFVPEAMGRDFMTRRSNSEHDFGTVFCYPPKDEESAPRVVLVQEAEQRVDAARKSRWTRDPLVARDSGFQRFYLEVFLDVDGKEVRCRISVH